MRRVCDLAIYLIMFAAFTTAASGCHRLGGGYGWKEVTGKAAFPQAYNYPVFVFGDWMVALNNGAWLSRDGSRWHKTELPDSGLNTGYQKFIQFNGAIYALGALTGNYQQFSVSPKIMRTKDFVKWETIAETSNLPQRIFYGAAVFDHKIWMMGGYDGRNYLNDVWNSSDGVRWQKVIENAPWSGRTVPVLTVFRNRLWILGGGVIDGDTSNNRNSYKELWSSPDGRNWTAEYTTIDKKWGGTPVVYDDKLWLVGMNRGNGFASAVWVTADGLNWKEEMAPWSPRGGVAAWVASDKLFVTGGKSSHTENGEIKFVYSNDVWVMDKKSK